MTDPMTNVEIEDVLSSIRRLVAEGAPARAVSAPAPVPPRAMPKLVLTPALRVDAPAADPATPSHTPGPAAQASGETAMPPVNPSPIADRLNLMATIAELEAAVRAQPDEWEPDGTGTDLDMVWARAGFRGDVEVEDAVEVPGAPANVSAWPRTLVEAAKRYGGSDDGDETSPVPVAEFRHQTTENASPAAAEDGDFHDDLIGGPDLGPDPEAVLDSYLADDAVIDEAMLRDLVRDVVRQELQGKLGERITRNVRKLVRREIHRALTTELLD